MVRFMITIKLAASRLEHALERYNDDTGYGLTLCGAKVGPWDFGPNLSKIECLKCMAKVDKEEESVR